MIINDVNNLPLRERGAVTKARPQTLYVLMYVCGFCCKIVEVIYVDQ